MDKLTKLAINDLKTILDFMLEYGADGSLPNMDAGGSGDKAYEASHVKQKNTANRLFPIIFRFCFLFCKNSVTSVTA